MIARRLKAVVVLALLAPVAAHAQIAEGDRPRVDLPIEGTYGPVDPRAASIYAQTSETRDDVRHAVEAGQMSKRQGRDFNWQSRRIDGLAAQYSSNGPMSQSAGRELDMASRALDSLANAPAARAARLEQEKKRKKDKD